MKIAALGLYHEANTFSSVRADLPAFRAGGLLEGPQIEEAFGSSRSTMGGFYSAAEEHGFGLEPLVFARVNPTGPITEEALEHISGLMLSRLEERGPWDGVLLAWHGAAVADGHLDVEGDLLGRIRSVVGQGVPIGAVLDMHANVSPSMVEAVDVLIGYRTNPHVDAHERGEECAALLINVIAGEARPCQALCRIPLAPDITRQGTRDEPMRELLGLAEKLATEPLMLAVSLFEGFPYADVPQMGMSAVVVAHDNQPGADRAAQSLAEAVWEARQDFRGRAPKPAEALKRAAAAPRGPVVLLDVGDNIGGGGPGDSIVLLAEARRLGVSGIVQTINDAGAAARCIDAGSGARVDLEVGGKHPDSPHTGLRVKGVVGRITDGCFDEPGPVHAGFRHFDSGPTTLVETQEGNLIVLTSKLVSNTSLQQLKSLGIVPTDQKIIVAKGVNAPRVAYEKLAAMIIFVDTPGITRMSITELAYHHRPRPMYPFEEDVPFTPEVHHGA